jgi:transketolase C-terminal domain/subunit
VTPDFFAPLRWFEHIFALEEHMPYGGLASILRDAPLLESKVHSIALNPEPPASVGSQRYLRDMSGLDANSILNRIVSLS